MGGAYVAGNVDTRGGAFIGRDLIVKIGIPLALTLVIGIAMLVVAVNQGWLFAAQIRPVIDPFSVEQQKMPPGYFNIAVAPLDISTAQGDPKNLQKLGSNLSGWMAAYLKDHLPASATERQPAKRTCLGQRPARRSSHQAADRSSPLPDGRRPLAGPPERQPPDLRQARRRPQQYPTGARVLLQQPAGQRTARHRQRPPSLWRTGPDRIGRRRRHRHASHYKVQSDLGQRSEAFVWLITALTQANAKLPEAALATLQAAQAKIGAETALGVKGNLLLLRGFDRAADSQLARSAAAFTAVRDPQQPIADPLQAIATIGLGNYHFLRAQGFFNAEQAQNAGLAQCAAAFSGTKLALGSSPDGPNAGAIPADLRRRVRRPAKRARISTPRPTAGWRKRTRSKRTPISSTRVPSPPS